MFFRTVFIIGLFLSIGSGFAESHDAAAPTEREASPKSIADFQKLCTEPLRNNWPGLTFVLDDSEIKKDKRISDYRIIVKVRDDKGKVQSDFLPFGDRMVRAFALGYSNKLEDGKPYVEYMIKVQVTDVDGNTFTKGSPDWKKSFVKGVCLSNADLPSLN